MDITWENGKLVQTKIRSELGRRCRIRTKTPLEIHHNGGLVATVTEAEDLLAFETSQGQQYVVTPAA